MRLANFGMIGLNGSVVRPEPGADFADYQHSLTNYRTMMSLKNRSAGATDDAEQRLKELAESVRQTLNHHGKLEQ